MATKNKACKANSALSETEISEALLYFKSVLGETQYSTQFIDLLADFFPLFCFENMTTPSSGRITPITVYNMKGELRASLVAA